LKDDPRAQGGRNPPTDYRALRRQSERRWLILVVLVLVIVGGGLIGLVYGVQALLAGLPCLLGGAGGIAALYLLFVLAERWVNR
jgi:hypothetical protein